MEVLFPLLLVSIASNASPTCATNAKSSDFKEMIRGKCQEWCEDASASVSSCDEADSAGVFELNIPEVGVKNVFCDVADDGGKWTVFQRRMHGNVDFDRGWDDYVNGFGDLRGDHWLGLEAMHQLTKDGNMELEIKMITSVGVYWVAKYSSFGIGPASDFYRLHVSGFSGNSTEDGLLYANLQQFSTKGADHDGWSQGDCADIIEGGWWRGHNCDGSNLNGNFHRADHKGIWWWSYYNFQRFTEMKMRERA